MSWSSVNYGGKWKVLMYAAKNFFNPLLLSAEYLNATATATAFITSDVPAPIGGACSSLHLRKPCSAEVLCERAMAFRQEAAAGSSYMACDMRQ